MTTPVPRQDEPTQSEMNSSPAPGATPRRVKRAASRWIKRLISIALLAALVYFFWPLLGEIDDAAELFAQAHWEWALAALAIQLVSYLALTWLNALALQPFAGKIGFFQLAGLLTAMAFIQVAVPSAGASGIALRVRLLGKFGYKTEEALFSLAVETLAEIVAMVTIALIGVVYLLNSGQLSGWDVFWSALAGGSFILLLWLAWRLIMNQDASLVYVSKGVVIWNKVGSRIRRVEPMQATQRWQVFQNNLAFYRQVPLWKFIAAAYGKVLLDVATMGAGFLLFGYAIAAGRLLTGYGLVLTFSGMAALPGGLGMADAYVPVIFSWLDIPGEIALAAGLVYRLIAYWLVRFVGFLSWLAIEARH